METISVTRSTLVPAPPERVWRAVTEPAQLEKWYAPGCPWDIPVLAVGATVRFYNTPDETLTATIAVADAPREFTLHWHATPETPAEMVTTFRLEAAEHGTRVTIYETGYANLPNGAGPAHAAQAAEGYTASLALLQALLESEVA